MKEIKYIKRKDLDISKYDACIEQAVNSRIYAYSWYLDSVADHWDALVYGEYEAVMPLPFLRLKRNLFCSHVYTPPFIQQLGIFSQSNLDNEVIREFYTIFLKTKPKSYAFNNQYIPIISSQNFKERVNYELNLNTTYPDIYKNYSTNLKRKLKNPKIQDLQISQDISIDEILNFYRENKTVKINFSVFKKLKNLLEILLRVNKVQFLSVTYQSRRIAVLVLITDKDRFVNILPVSSKQGKQLNAMAFAIDHILKTNSEQTKIFDFEGSIIPGIAQFYASFGAKKTSYYFYEKPFSLF